MSKTLEVKEANAIAAYKGADAKGKTLLADLFGKKVFNQKITDRVTSFSDVLTITGMSSEEFNRLYGNSPVSQAFGKLELIARVLNEGWEPNWNDNNEPKYFNWFNMDNGFSFIDVGSSYQVSIVSSRLCFKSSDLALYAAKQFFDIYKTFMTL